jgi:hypothetical protein
MASSGKQKTTMAKLKREATLRERRHEKAIRKQIRKEAQLNPQPEVLEGDEFELGEIDADGIHADGLDGDRLEPEAQDISGASDAGSDGPVVEPQPSVGL